MRRAGWLAPALLLAGCERRGDVGPVVVSVIGGAPALSAAPPAGAGDRLLRDSVAQGLVRFDAAGQVEPGLASRWIVIDGGRSYIFRLADAEWPDGTAVTAEQVAAILTRAIAAGSDNPLLPYLSAIDEVVAMTGQVIEVRLKRQRPDLLKLFAQPELALLRLRPAPGGAGPFRATPAGPWTTLRPAPDPNRDLDQADAEPDPREDVRLIGENAARAIVRFTTRRSDLVSGGTFIDWPLVPLAHIPPASIRVDPAAGLFGLAIVNREGFLADAANRAALARAIDRTAITQAYEPGSWGAAEAILPEALDSAAPPALPLWSAQAAGASQPAPRDVVAAWRQSHPDPLRLRLALPEGPGATRLHAFVAAGLLRIGIQVVRVPQDAPADLRLIDAVAPYDSARWYLATACRPCSTEAADALAQARDAATMPLRAQWIAQADRLIAADVPFIMIARPLRWSLVSLRLTQWQPNPRAWHPLNHLRGDPTS